MKPIYLEFKGVNSFSEKTVIDFKTLLSGGLFGIFGDTGSGKSTVLDCIHLALYGKIGRSSEVDCINYRCEGYEIVYEFELLIEGERKTYRVERSRKRKNNVSDGQLYEKNEAGKWAAIANGTREVNQKLLSIIGLEYEDFKVCIALPQGDFAKLVQAKSSERLELVSRLFNLEKYGKRLTQKISERKRVADTAEQVLKAKLETLGVEEEGAIEERKARLQEEEKRAIELAKSLKAVEMEESSLQKLADKKAEYEAAKAAYAQAQERLPEYQAKKKKVERYPAAKAVQEKIEERARLSELGVRLEREKETATKACETANEALLAAENKLTNGKFDEALTEIEVKIAQAKSVETDRKEAERARAEWLKCRAEYKALKSETIEENFEEKLADIDGKISALGSDCSLAEFLKNNFKDVLLSEEYGEVRKDLRALVNEYPIVEKRVETLIQKYTPVQAGDKKSFDIAEAKLAFDKAEKTRASFREERLKIERRLVAYQSNTARLELLKKQGDGFRVQAETAERKIAELGAEDLSVLEEKKKEIQRRKADAETARKTAQERLYAAQSETAEKGARIAQTAEDLLRVRSELEKSLEEYGFANTEEVKSFLQSVYSYEQEKAKVETFFASYEAKKMRVEEFKTEEFAGFDAERLILLKGERERLEREKEVLAASIGAAQNALSALIQKAEEAKAIQGELVKTSAERERLEKLSKLTYGGAFMNFVAGEYLQDVSRQASATLLSLTGGKYFLLYENKEFSVGDNLNGGKTRAVRTLSGGETFLVSLSLALALSSAICESVRHVEFFFLDEGFGTLDQKLVDTVMDVLGKLSKDFSIGLISHVEELKHRIHHKIIVESANEQRGSVVRMETH